MVILLIKESQRYVKTRKKICKELSRLQKNIKNMFTLNINVDTLKALLND